MNGRDPEGALAPETTRSGIDDAGETAGDTAARVSRSARAGDDRVFGIDPPADALIRGLFAVGLDLHTALAHLEQHVGEEVAAARVRQAIARLDEAIKDIRRVIFSPRTEHPPYAGGMRSMVVDAVGRACGPARNGPVITLRSGVDSVIDTAASRRLAGLVQEILTMVPEDRLSRAHVEVRPASRPPGRLVVQIDVPGDDLCDLARLLGAARLHGVAVSSHAVAGATSRSRIRLECPAAAS